MDITKLHETGAAIVHQLHGDPFPHMIWPTNHTKLAAATMFTCAKTLDSPMITLTIEWRHLSREGNTCIRCSDTGETLEQVVEQLARECRPQGWEIRFVETRLSVDEISESNLILFDGKPIEDILPGAYRSDSHCPSCCEFTGVPSTVCRTLEFDGETHESIPASLIRQAACELTRCC